MDALEILDIIENGKSVDDPGQKIKYGSEWKLLKRIKKGDSYWTGVLPADKVTGAGTALQAFHKYGFSLVMNKVQAHSRGVYRVARLLEDLLGWRISVNMYLSPAESQGFEVHIDWMDGLILQVLKLSQAILRHF